MKLATLLVASLALAAPATAQQTTITYSLSQTSAAISQYTNDGETMTVLQEIANSFHCPNANYTVPSLHASTSYFSTNYPFVPGYSYSVTVSAQASASGNMANPNAQNVYWGMSVGSPVLTTSNLSAACNPFPDGYEVTGYLGEFTELWPNINPTPVSTVDLSTNFLTGIVAVGGYANTNTVGNSSSGSFTVTSSQSQFNLEAFPVAGDVPIPTGSGNGCGAQTNPTVNPTNTNITFYSVTINATPIITPAVNYVCSSQTYSIPGSVVPTWSVSPAGIVTIAPNGTSCTVTRVAEGNVVLTATLPAPGSISSSISISTQPTITNIVYGQTGSCNGSYQEWSLAATANAPGANSWQWTDRVVSGSCIIYSPGSPSTIASTSGGAELTVTFKDACGYLSLQNGVTIWSNCNKEEAVHFDASPNPAGSMVNITPHRTDAGGGVPAHGHLSGPLSIQEVKVFDIQGRTRSDVHYGNGQTQTMLDVSKLENGIYFVLIYSGETIERKKILVQR